MKNIDRNVWLAFGLMMQAIVDARGLMGRGENVEAAKILDAVIKEAARLTTGPLRRDS